MARSLNETEVTTIGWIRLARNYAVTAELLVKLDDEKHQLPADLLCAHALETSLKGLVHFASDSVEKPKDFGHNTLKAWDAAKRYPIGTSILEKADKHIRLFWKNLWRAENMRYEKEIEATGFLTNENAENFGIWTHSQIGEALPKLRDTVEWYGERNDSPNHRFRYPWTGLDYRKRATVGGHHIEIMPMTAIIGSLFLCAEIERIVRADIK